MKVLFHSNAPWSPTGYGQQTALFAPLLKEHVDELTISSFFGLDGHPLAWQGIPVLPGVPGEFGNVTLVDHARDVFGGNPRDGLVLTLMDVWVLQPGVISQLNTACWVPVDHDPAPPAVIDFFEQSGATPIAMSRFGAEQLERFNPLYVPHGVDTSIYTPRDKTVVRERFGLTDQDFLVGIVAANKGRPSRKAFSESLQALKPFMDAHENAHLYLHTTMDPVLSGGENLVRLIDALAIPRERIILTDQYRNTFRPHTREEMAQIYSAMDVLLNPAHGEGFGITPLEAQACGVPVIVGDNTAQREVAGAGWHVECRPFWTGQNSWQFQPDVADITSALEEAYALPASRRAALSAAAVRHAASYDVDRVFRRYWLPALEQLQSNLNAQRPVTIAPKAVAA